jgi:predicted DCC family thiol-disulfide oxidoreductase YuxK
MKAIPASKPEEEAPGDSPMAGARAARPPELREGSVRAGEVARTPYSLSALPDFPPGCRGWVFYDALCPICLATLRRWVGLFRSRGFEFAPIQDEWVRRVLGLALGELPPEMKLLLKDGRLLGGVDAVREMSRTVWWLWPLAVLSGWPGLRTLAGRAYRWIASNRYCLGDVCPLPRRHRVPHHAATTFLELP